MFAEYKRDVSHNYLILHGDETINTTSYQVRILTGNTMSSILKCRMQGLDGTWLFYYDITSKQSLASFYEQRKLQGEDLEMILKGFLHVIEEMAEFLLNTEQLVLCPEYIFLDVEKKADHVYTLVDGTAFKTAMDLEGKEYTATIRPDDIRLADETAFENVLGGKIGVRTFLGKSYQYEVETAAGILKVNMGTDHVFKEGDVLRLYLPEDKLILVRR